MNSDLILKASDFAERAHEGQTRKHSNVPYFKHVKGVAELVATQTDCPELIAAGYLHDTMEDCGVSRQQLVEQFGGSVADLVEALTNDEAELERLGKVEYMVGKMNKLSADALLVKLCDTLNNSSDTPSANQANNYNQIITHLINNPPATWTPQHQALAERIISKLSPLLS